MRQEPHHKGPCGMWRKCVSYHQGCRKPHTYFKQGKETPPFAITLYQTPTEKNLCQNFLPKGKVSEKTILLAIFESYSWHVRLRKGRAFCCCFFWKEKHIWVRGLFCLCSTSSFLRSQAGWCGNAGACVVLPGLTNESRGARLRWYLLVFCPLSSQFESHHISSSLAISCTQHVPATWHGQTQFQNKPVKLVLL